ncbi:VCBS domain-containing protein [uncultured Psychrosphaera sp.]|uniref:VCBS domain-containing protein n=1 Tax=uncultured Psychrosphaera sp. TaxID=1403522 RepID=UPI00261C7B17|nr:VCBS domain-containing protein [uncultured Psychrosphaera sp.]
MSKMKTNLSMCAIALALSLSGCGSDSDGGSDNSGTDNSGSGSSENTAATFAGDFLGAGNKETSDDITGSITVTDPDADEAAVVPQTDVAKNYGTFSIAANGAWTYTIDLANTTVASLGNEADSITESIVIASVDGTTQVLVITISGVPADQIAKISDTDIGDTGELNYGFEEATTTGKLSLSILYGADEVETAYISLYDAEGSTSTVIGELALNEGKFGLRKNTYNDGEEPSKASKATSTIDYDAIDAPDFTAGEWIDVVMTWDNSSATERGTYSIVIDGTTYGPFDSEFPTPEAAVESISVRLSSNGNTSADAIYVNDLGIYSDVAGTTAIFEDDFEGYSVGDSLSDANTETPYGSRTFEAVVAIFGQGVSVTPSAEAIFISTQADVNVGTAGNKVAVMTDTDVLDGGELRIKLSSSDIIEKGRLTASFNKSSAANCTFETNEKDAYVAIYGTDTSSYNALVDLRIDGSDYSSDYALRNKNEDGNKTVEVTGATFAAETWTDVEITWDATDATETLGPLVTVSLDGTEVVAEYNSYSESLSELIGGAQSFAFKIGDTGSNMPNCEFKVDNIKLYSIDDADAETLMFSENFGDYADGDDLEPEAAATTYLYNSSTNEAVVGTEN